MKVDFFHRISSDYGFSSPNPSQCCSTSLFTQNHTFSFFLLENKGATKINKNETNKEKKRDPKKNHKKHIQIQRNMYSHTQKSLINIKLKIIQIIKQKILKLKGGEGAEKAL